MTDKSFLIKVVPFGSAAYNQSIELRDRILRKPLGMEFTAEQLAAEQDQIHICGFMDDNLIACLILEEGTLQTCQMRQVAVDEAYQKKEFGKRLVLFAEKYALNQGFKKIFCHARDVALPFYLSLKYTIKGEPFIEIGIQHFFMEKVL
jgi:predicted GNAT family N-acyltransferase